MREENTRWPFIITILLVASGLAVIYFFGFPRSEPARAEIIVSPTLIPPPVDDNTPSTLPEPTPIPTPSIEPAPAVDFPAPDFLLTNTQGDQIQLSDLKGQPVLINFWATWCAPCRIEMPAIQNRFGAFRDQGFVVLAVDFDEPADDVRSFGVEFGLDFDLLLDPGGEIQKLYRVRGYPTSFFVGRDGFIKVQHIGLMTEGQLDGYLAQIGLDD
jgi:peroxiredoxin